MGFDHEQFYRDNRLNPIHEGTHGIHGLDLLGRKVVMKQGAALDVLRNRIQRTIERAATTDDESLRTSAGALDVQLVRLLLVTRRLWEAPDASVTLANASLYLEAFGHVVMAWIWLEQLLTAQGKSGDFYEGKRAAARYFFLYELPRIGPQFDLLTSLDTTTLDMADAWF